LISLNVVDAPRERRSRGVAFILRKDGSCVLGTGEQEVLMDVTKLEDADKATRAAAKEANAKVAGAKRRLKAAKKGARGAKAELRKARKLLRQAKGEARRAEKRARKNGRKLSRALKNSKRAADRSQKVDRQPRKPSPRRRSNHTHVSSAAANSGDVTPAVVLEPSVQTP
jgi:hypothetical protein